MSKLWYFMICLFPQNAFQFAIMKYWFPENKTFSQADAIVTQFVNVGLYLALYFWLDQVLPNEYGIRKPLLYFLDKKKRPSASSQSELR